MWWYVSLILTLGGDRLSKHQKKKKIRKTSTLQADRNNSSDTEHTPCTTPWLQAEEPPQLEAKIVNFVTSILPLENSYLHADIINGSDTESLSCQSSPQVPSPTGLYQEVSAGRQEREMRGEGALLRAGLQAWLSQGLRW